MLKKLKIKFITITMVLVSIIVCFVFTLIFHSNVRAIYESSISDLKKISELSISDFTDGVVNDDIKDLQYIPLLIIKIDENNEVVSQIKSNINIDDKTLRTLISKVDKKYNSIGTIDEFELRYYKEKIGNYKKITFIDISRESKSLESLFIILLLTGVFTLATFFLIILFLSSWALKPVELAWNQQKQFIADASHELKTPLTVLLANMDILEDNKTDTINNQIKWIQASKQEAIQMKHLIEEMLFLAKSDANKIEKIYSKINISDLLISQILSLEVIAFEKNVNINYDNIQEDLYIKANEKQIVSLLSILLENACKYCDSNTNITVRLKKESEKIKFEVNNIGPVIPKSEILHIFERFYRVEKSRNKEHGGYGLGLSIAKKISDENNMKISVESTAEKGTTFRVVMNPCTE